MKTHDYTDQWRAMFETSAPTRHPTGAQKRLAAKVRSEFARTGSPVDVYHSQVGGSLLTANWRTIAKLIAIGDLFPVSAHATDWSPEFRFDAWVSLVPAESLKKEVSR